MKTSLLHLTLALTLTAAPAVFGAGQLTGMQVYNKGLAALEKGDLVTARQSFEQLLKAKPDFELARIQLAQVVVAERELARIPQSLKVAHREVLPQMELHEVPFEEAAAAVTRSLERAGGGSEKWNVNLGAHLPDPIRKRSVSLSASGATVDDILEALGYAGGVQFSYTATGLAVREAAGQPRGKYDAGKPKASGLSGAAGKLVIERFAMEEATVAEALTYLQRKSVELSGGTLKPLFVIRHDIVPRGGVTLDLRNISLRDAVNSVCLMADLEVKWFPWGAGIGSRQAAAAVAGPAEKEETAK